MTRQKNPRPYASSPCSLHELDTGWLSFDEPEAPEEDNRTESKNEKEKPETKPNNTITQESVS